MDDYCAIIAGVQELLAEALPRPYTARPERRRLQVARPNDIFIILVFTLQDTICWGYPRYYWTPPGLLRGAEYRYEHPGAPDRLVADVVAAVRHHQKCRQPLAGRLSRVTV